MAKSGSPNCFSSLISQAQDSQTTQLLTCAYCRGTGRDRFGVLSSLSTCAICGGKGKNPFPAQVVPCAYCQGTGASPIGARNPCLACRGKGFHPGSETMQNCPDCQGRGSLGESHFYCRRCRGAGQISIRA